MPLMLPLNHAFDIATEICTGFQEADADQCCLFCVQKEPALPSERYLKILQKGAKHSQLASEYQVYLHALQHYHASKPGQRIGRSLMSNVFGRPLKFLVLRVLPTVHNKFLVWTIHHIFERMLLLMWLLHDYLLEPILGSGRHL